MEARAEIYNFSHDINGNANSHYTLWIDGKVAHRTKRRQQCGYIESFSDDALWRLEKITGKSFKVSSFEGSRSNGAISVTFSEDRG